MSSQCCLGTAVSASTRSTLLLPRRGSSPSPSVTVFLSPATRNWQWTLLPTLPTTTPQRRQGDEDHRWSRLSAAPIFSLCCRPHSLCSLLHRPRRTRVLRPFVFAYALTTTLLSIARLVPTPVSYAPVPFFVLSKNTNKFSHNCSFESSIYLHLAQFTTIDYFCTLFLTHLTI